MKKHKISMMLYSTLLPIILLQSGFGNYSNYIWLILVIVLIAFCVLPMMRMRHRNSKSKENMETASYTCPMHPEVKSDKPGNCPKCGMALEKVNKI